MSGTMKRKIGGVLCAALCMLCLAVPALAAPSYVPLSDYPHIEGALTKISDGVYEFEVSLADEDIETQQAWKRVMGEWMPDDGYILFTSFSPNASNAGFSILAGPVSSVTSSGGSTPTLRVASGYLFTFDMQGNLTDYRKITSNYSAFSSNIYFNNYAFPENSYRYYQCFEDIKELRITDDLDGEPEPPSSSSAPEVPDVPYEPGKPPTGGGASDNLPYDPSIWEAFMWYMRDTIGGLGNILILIAFLLSVVPLIISAIRHYAGTRNDNGGNLL